MKPLVHGVMEYGGHTLQRADALEGIAGLEMVRSAVRLAPKSRAARLFFRITNRLRWLSDLWRENRQLLEMARRCRPDAERRRAIGESGYDVETLARRVAETVRAPAVADRPGGREAGPKAPRGSGPAPAILPLALFALLLPTVAGCSGASPPGKPAAADGAGSAREAAPPPPAAQAEVVRVRLETEAGPIVLALDARRAPVTTANFLAYVDQHRFDDTTFYRAARTPGAAGRGFIQGGIRRNYRRMLPPIAHEPTSRTGLRHDAGTISMARAQEGAGAMGDFFITASAMPQMDAHGGEPGFAAFGRVVEGMDNVRHILAAPTVADAGRGAMRGQMIAAPVAITSARRLP